jgi:putative ABC transport system permease protein
VFVALREMSRAKVRFGLLAVALGLLVFLILFQVALRDGLITQFIGALRNQSAPVLVYGDQARKNLEGSQITPDQLTAIADVEGVEAVGRFGEGTFTVTTPASRDEDEADDRLLDAVIFGHEIDGPAAGLGSPTTLVEGRQVERPGEAVASTGNGDLGFEIGAVVRVEPDGLEIEIVGMADDVNYSVSPTLFVAWETYEDARRIRNPDATAVFASVAAVQPAEGIDHDDLTADIDAAVEGVEALTRQGAVDGSPGVSSVRSSLDTVVNLLRFAVFLVVGLFMLIITVQKLGSLTLMKALGATNRILVRALVLQAVMLVLAGGVIGTILFSLVAAASGGTGIGIRVDPAVIVPTVGGIVAAAMLATVFAALRIRRIQPADVTQTAGALR